MMLHAGDAEAGPSLDLRRALEIDLPQDDGCWNDADFERVLSAIDTHFGDQPVQHDIEENQDNDSLDDLGE